MTRCGNKSDHCAVVYIRRRRYPVTVRGGVEEDDIILSHLWTTRTCVLYGVFGLRWLRGEGHQKG